MDVSEIRRQLEAARKDLLDVTMRNRMLNYRELKARGAEIVGDTASRVHDLLTSTSRVGFLPLDVTVDSGTDLVPYDDEVARLRSAMIDEAARRRGAVLQTPYDPKKLYKRLLSTYRSARTLLQEQGTSNLFMALGMLEWYESDDSSTARYAPLALLPVELQRTGVKERFHLAATEDDPQPNPSLVAKLRDFSIDLPMFEASEDLNLEAYFGEVSRAIRGGQRWKVHEDRVALAFFSFSRYLMYLDLDEDAWDGNKLSEHPVVAALLGDGFREPPSSINESERLDEQEPPDAVTLVMDADSSQMTAALDVIAGRNLVVEGPPGTGKSQTIANVMADAVQRGKKVLFVSEKMAALEVVKRRLESNGLGDVALELHSNKARKKDVLRELERTLNLGFPAASPDDRTVQDLVNTITYLNGYDDAVNTPLDGQEVTPIDAFGHAGTPDALLDDFTSGISLEGWQEWSPSDVEERRTTLQQLAEWTNHHGKPAAHPYWGSAVDTVLPQHERAAVEGADKLQAATQALSRRAASAAEALPEAEIDTPKGSSSLFRTAELLRRAPPWTPSLRSKIWDTVDADVLDAALDAGARLTEIRGQYAKRLRQEAWDADVADIKIELETPRNWLERLFSDAYRQAVRRARDLHESGERPARKDLLGTIRALSEAATRTEAVESTSELGAELFGDRWKGPQSDFPSLKIMTTWRLTVRRGLNEVKLDPRILAWVETSAVRDYSESQQDDLRTALADYRSARDALADALKFDEDARFGEGGLPQQTFEEHERFTESLKHHAPDWRYLGQYWSASRKAITLGLNSFEGFATHGDHGTRVVDAFDRWWYRSIAEKALEVRPELSLFDRSSHESRISDLNRLDQTYLRDNRAKIAKTHHSNLPLNGHGGQVGILYHEFNKKRRHLPVRRLMRSAGNAIQAIKPVFMMSPLSVAQFIPPGSITFDLVVFDEASQVRPADALGAIIRGHQAVVVGDSKQLPPTSFFDAMVELDEDDPDTATSDIESILTMFRSKQAPSRMLRWHYRSRHESLIAVSNQEFYDNQLLVFPSPAGQRDGLGLVYHPMPNTTYDRGRSRTNREEARAVAEAVMQHAREHPELSLGVAAFSSAQATAIEDEVERLRREHDAQESYFDDHQDEPFFVKNLETVQGDERDVIFISVGYGRDTNGRLAMNFGPLNQDGGERRLNVLITRSKRRCEVFTNISADDIPGDGSQAAGVKALKAFLKYAQTGVLEHAQATDREPDSPFERAVAGALRDRGYTIHPQVGVAGFYIDIGVVDPMAEGRYLLGIECDGATYHSARSARDRDRLRQAVLEDLGWQLHRIWSTDWFRDPTAELQRTINAIEKARATSTMPARLPRRVTKTGPGTDTSVRRQAPFQRPTAPGPDGAVPYKQAQIQASLRWDQQLHQVNATTMARWIMDVVTQEGPVHTATATKRITEAVGVSRAGSRIQSAVQRGVRAARDNGLIQVRGDFLWPSGTHEPSVRDRSTLPGALRKIEYVPPEEIDLAARCVLEDSRGMARADTAPAIAQLLGFGRASASIREAIEKRIELLETRGEIGEQGDFLIVKARP